MAEQLFPTKWAPPLSRMTWADVLNGRRWFVRVIHDPKHNETFVELRRRRQKIEPYEAFDGSIAVRTWNIESLVMGFKLKGRRIQRLLRG